MRTDPGGLRLWTERFVVAGAVGLVVSLISVAVGAPGTGAIVALFGFVCPTIFGMAYLLLPPYVGRTLADRRLPDLHLVIAYGGVGLLLADRHLEAAPGGLGTVSWGLGVAVFAVALIETVLPALKEESDVVLGGDPRPTRSSRLATWTIPVALVYLLGGTTVLVAGGDRWLSPTVAHAYAVGFGALLVFSLGARLLVGFFHVVPPRAILIPVLISGASAPLFLTVAPWEDPWFPAGAALESFAMLGYLIVVATIEVRTDRRRVGIAGIVLGAVAGAVGVAVAAPLSVGTVVVDRAIAVHRTAILWGFFPLTILGYAFLFFPVTHGRFLGASWRGASATVGLLGVGLLARLVGIAAPSTPLRIAGVLASTLGALGYLYLVARRFYG